MADEDVTRDDVVEDTDSDTKDVEETENTDTENAVEDVAEDVDADTRDVEDTQESDTSRLYERMGEMMDMIGSVVARLDEVQAAQSVMVRDVPIIDAPIEDNAPLDFEFDSNDDSDELNFDF